MNLFIRDRNDNLPVFEKPLYEATILENAEIGSYLVKVVATDKDDGDNAKVYYSIEEKTVQDDRVDEVFEVDASAGVLKIAKVLDRERVSEYRFNIIASNYFEQKISVHKRLANQHRQQNQKKNKQKHSKSSSTEILLRIKDVDDNGPAFLQPRLFFKMQENQPAKTLVGRVRAHDPDSPPNDQLSHSFLKKEHESMFHLDPLTGDMTTNKILDREVKEFHYLTVMAFSKTGNRLNATCQVAVQVLDQNDNDPVFIFPSSLSSSASSDTQMIRVQLDHPIGTEVMFLTASDADVGVNANINYIILPEGNASKYFRLDSKTGSLQLGLNKCFMNIIP